MMQRSILVGKVRSIGAVRKRMSGSIAAIEEFMALGLCAARETEYE